MVQTTVLFLFVEWCRTNQVDSRENVIWPYSGPSRTLMCTGLFHEPWSSMKYLSDMGEGVDVCCFIGRVSNILVFVA